MADTASTHVSRRGPSPRRRRRTFGVVGSAPVVMKRVPSVGSRAYLHFDPVTGRRKTKVAA